MKSSIH